MGQWIDQKYALLRIQQIEAESTAIQVTAIQVTDGY